MQLAYASYRTITSQNLYSAEYSDNVIGCEWAHSNCKRAYAYSS